jgi:phage terminase small subunit
MAKKKQAAPRRLTPQQRLFAIEYTKDFNATKAAKRAGYSEATAQEQGSRLLSNVMVSDAIAIGTDRMLNESAVSVGRVIREYSRIAFSELTDLVQWDNEGNVAWTPSDDLEPEQRALIGEFSQTITEIPQKGGGEPIIKTQIKAKYHDKMAALAKLFEYLALAKKDGTISMEALNHYVEQLGMEVVAAAQEAIADEDSRSALLAALDRRWQSVGLDLKPRVKRPSEGSGEE